MATSAPANEGISLLRLFLLGLFVVVAAVFIASTWFEGAIVVGIVRVLDLIPDTVGWLIEAF